MSFPKKDDGTIDLTKISVEQFIDVGFEFFDGSLDNLKHAASNGDFDTARNILKNIEAWDIIVKMIVPERFLFTWKEMKDKELKGEDNA